MPDERKDDSGASWSSFLAIMVVVSVLAAVGVYTVTMWVLRWIW